MFKNAFILGTNNECIVRECDIIKLGNKGIMFKGNIYKSNEILAKYKTGLGDIFDGFFIHYMLNDYSIKKAIKNSIKKVEKVLDIPGAFNKINSLF
ncbi:hypothetical protein [Marinitoga lauensis]|uniref:hypothetical protein n=1 Tax=Marinitoga lauensis TaxID=2201189 RepID=UPI00101024F9|nr:hypothetical protein [Marinitoga lauensis]